MIKEPISVFICLFKSRWKEIPFPNLLQTWLVKIRRDASKDFKSTKRTKICSRYGFKDSDFRLTLKGRRYIKLFHPYLRGQGRLQIENRREKSKMSLRCPLLVRRWIIWRPVKTTRLIVRTKKLPQYRRKN